MTLDFTLDLIRRIMLAALLGGMVGLEREWSGRAAGLRTNMLICIGSCLFTILSIYGFQSDAGIVDPSRIAAQIVTGVGFLCAGALIHRGGHVSGLTTAADIWVVSGIGMAVAVNLSYVAIFVTLLCVTTLYFLAPVSNWLEMNAGDLHREREDQQRALHRKPTATYRTRKSSKRAS